MVVRIRKSRKYFGTRRWGAGNIKNRRGAGERGGVGRGGRKHKMTYLLVYERESLHHKGFAPFRRRRLEEIDLTGVSRRAQASGEARPVIELRGYKVLGDGVLEKPAVIRATNFTESAERKIREAGGEAVRLGAGKNVKEAEAKQ